MDNLTHAFAGCLIAAGTVALVERRGTPVTPVFRRAATALAIIGAELPDADLLYAGRLLDHGKLGYLLHHRGYTHTIVFVVAAALLLWCAALALKRELRAPAYRQSLLWLSLVASLSHIALDYTNSYGVHPFWPLDNRWYYGDAVFIVEPWLWIAALPPLLFVARQQGTRLLFGVSLLAILAAAWTLDMVGQGVALSVTVGALLWLAVIWRARLSRRVWYGIAAWCAVEAMFFIASANARAAVQSLEPPAQLREVALTPVTGNPLCFHALVVGVSGDRYDVNAATVAAFPFVRDAATCAGRSDARAPIERTTSATDATNGTAHDSAGARPSTRAVAWTRAWTMSRAELRGLVRDNCEIAAVMRFMRVPAWQREGDGTVRVFDLRFGEQGGGFAGIETPATRTGCAGTLPPWRAPRSDVIALE